MSRNELARRIQWSWWGWLAALAGFGLGLGIVCLGGAGVGLLLPGPAAAPPRPATQPAALATSTAPVDGSQAAPVETLIVVTPSASPAPYAQVGDVPLPEGVRPEAALGPPDDFSLLTQLSFDQVAVFYQSAMPEQGWALVQVDDALADRLLDLHYTRGDQTLALKIVRLPFVGTLIAATTVGAE